MVAGHFTLTRTGDITQPLKSGALKKTGVHGDLFALCRGEKKGRTGNMQITLFKSNGIAAWDLAAAAAVYRQAQERGLGRTLPFWQTT